jgi:hypothetical protein
MMQFEMKRILYHPIGRIVMSVLLGLGFACLFYRACKEKDCINFHGPVIQEIQNKTFEFDSKCYKYEPVPVKCDNTKTKKIVDFASSKQDPMTESFMDYMQYRAKLDFDSYPEDIFRTAMPAGASFTKGPTPTADPSPTRPTRKAGDSYDAYNDDA